MSPQHDIAEPYKGAWERTNQRFVLPLLMVVGMLVLSVAGRPLSAQEATRTADGPSAGTEPPTIEFKVTELPRTGQSINVAVNKGVLVDFSVPLREVRLANPDIADVAVTASNQLLITGKSFGTTQLVAWLDGDRQHVFDVAVDLDLERLQASIRSAVPRARVQASSVLDTVVLSGTAPDTESAQKIAEIATIYSDKVVNHVRVAGVQQVVLRCTVAELNRSATRALGFSGWMAGDHFQDAFVVSNLAGLNPVSISGAPGANPARTVPFVTGDMSLGPAAQLSFGFPRVQMQAFVQALRENGLLKILAEPNLVTISGQEADFLAGGEFPVPVPQRDAVTIEYREFGVRLRFTPVVLSQNIIRLRVAPEVSEPDYATAVTLGGFVIPGLIQRRVETTVELGAGETFAIGGLLSERVRATSSKIPGLGDVPVLGALFRSVHYQAEETELVVLVTPELVAPLWPEQIAHVPGAHVVAPNDAELFLEGRLEGRRGQPRSGAAEVPSHAWPARSAELYGPAVCRLRGPVGPAGSDEGG